MSVTGLDSLAWRLAPEYWDGSIKPKQNFVDRALTVEDLQAAMESVQQNRARLALGTSGRFQSTGTHGDVTYVIGIQNGKIGQCYPEQYTQAGMPLAF